MKKEKISNIVMIVISIILIIVIVNLYKVAFQREMVILESKTENKIKESKALAIMYETGVESGEYVASDETTWPTENYVFNEALSKCENGSSISYDGTNVKVLANKSDRCYVYFDREVITLADYIKRLYSSENEGKNGLYLHDGYGTYTNVELEAGDGSYRYAGANVNNYVCFGNDADPCPVDNLYRIIGVYNDNVKLMKAEYATSEMLGTDGDYGMQYNESGNDTSYYKSLNVAIEDVAGYYWNNNTTSTGTNHWEESLLNKTNLNTNYVNYLNNIDTKWMNCIQTTTWYVAGLNSAYNRGVDSTAKTTYDWEIGDNATKEGNYTATDASTAYAEYSDEIGLAYVNEYMYAASPTYWSYPGYSGSGGDYDYRSSGNDNWMYLGLSEWSITRNSDDTGSVYDPGNDAHVGYGAVYYYPLAIRPTFYLKSTTNYIRGAGTTSDPYKIF